MADDKAVLELQIEVRSAIARMDELTARYIADLQAMAAASEAGLKPASAEFDALRLKALASGEAVLQAGNQGRESMAALAAATGKPIAEIEVLEKQVVELRGQLEILRKENASGAASFNLVGANVEKLGSKFKTVGSGILATFALGPVIGLITTLQGVLEEMLVKLRDWTAFMLAGGESVAQMTDKVIPLNEALQKLAGHQNALTQVQAEQIAQQINYRISVEDVRLAIEKHNTAIDDANEKFSKQIAVAKSVEDIRRAMFARTMDLKKAEEEYAESISGTKQAMEEMLLVAHRAASTRQELFEQITGPTHNALQMETEDLLKVITATEQHEMVSKVVRQKIKEQLEEELNKYDDWGKKVPERLAEVAKSYGALSDKQKETAAASKAFWDNEFALLEKAKQKNLDELKPTEAHKKKQGEAAGLRKEIAELEGLTTLTVEQQNELDELKNQLADTGQELTNTSQLTNEAVNSTLAAVKPTAAEFASLANELEAAGHNFGSFGNTLSEIDPEFQQHNENVQEAVANTEALNKQLEGTGIKFIEGTEHVNTQAEAIAGLAERQDDLGGSVGTLNEQFGAASKATEDLTGKTEKTGDATKSLDDKVKELAEKVEDMGAKYEKAFGPEQVKRVKDLAAAMRDDLLPVARELRDCLQATGAD